MLQPTNYYHIYNHANGDENIYRTDENYRFFLAKHSHYIAPIADTFCYCLMPNHFHLLIRIKSFQELLQLPICKILSDAEKNSISTDIVLANQQDFAKQTEIFLSRQFSNLFNSYTKSFNKMYDRKGSLFQQNFKRKKIENETYFTRLVQYIHCNPVHHGFVTNAEDWHWSSYNSYFSTKKTQLSKEEAIKWFGNIEDFREFHKKKAHCSLVFDHKVNAIPSRFLKPRGYKIHYLLSNKIDKTFKVLKTLKV